LFNGPFGPEVELNFPSINCPFNRVKEASIESFTLLTIPRQTLHLLNVIQDKEISGNFSHNLDISLQFLEFLSEYRVQVVFFVHNHQQRSLILSILLIPIFLGN